MCIHNPLSVKHFHGVSAGNVHECSLKPRIGKASIYLTHLALYVTILVMVVLHVPGSSTWWHLDLFRKHHWKAAWLGVYWGIGHTLTLLAAGTLLVVLRAEMPGIASEFLSWAVALMLVGFGFRAIYLSANCKMLVLM